MKKIKADKSLWPDELKSSYDFFDEHYDYYYEYQYKCKKCSTPSVWTAEEQKYNCETLKIPWSNRIFCKSCFIKYKQLKEDLKKYSDLWQNENENEKSKAKYLPEWQSCIKEYKKYTSKYDKGMEIKLEKLLQK